MIRTNLNMGNPFREISGRKTADFLKFVGSSLSAALLKFHSIRLFKVFNMEHDASHGAGT